MKTINNYILEKLKINKNSKVSVNSLVDNMLEIIDVNDNIKIKDIFENWTSGYNKKLYCYVSDVDYKFRYKDFSYDNISINKVNDSLIKKAEDIANQSTVYKKKNDDDKINKITFSQNDLAVYITGWRPVIFEKIKI